MQIIFRKTIYMYSEKKTKLTLVLITVCIDPFMHFPKNGIYSQRFKHFFLNYIFFCLNFDYNFHSITCNLYSIQ